MSAIFLSSCKPGLPQTALMGLQRDFPGRDMFSGMKSHHSLSFPSWLWKKGRKQVIKPHYFQNRAKGKDDSMETGPIGVSTPTGVMNLSGPDWLFRVDLEVIKDATASWPWAGVDLDIGVFLVRKEQRKAAGAPVPAPQPGGNCLSKRLRCLGTAFPCRTSTYSAHLLRLLWPWQYCKGRVFTWLNCSWTISPMY